MGFTFPSPIFHLAMPRQDSIGCIAAMVAKPPMHYNKSGGIISRQFPRTNLFLKDYIYIYV